MRIPKLARHPSGHYYTRIKKKGKWFGKDKTEATQKYLAVILEHYGTVPPSHARPCSCTVADLLDQFRVDQLKRCQPRWRRRRAGIIKYATEHALRLYGKLSADDFGPRCFQTVREMMAQKQGRSRGYVNDLARKLRSAWKWGVTQELVTFESYSRLALVPDLVQGELGLPEGTEREPVDPELVERTIPYLNERCADLVRLLQRTAARPDEIVRLRPEHIKKRKTGEWTFEPKEHKASKANKKRLIMFDDELKAILTKYLRVTEPGQYLFPADPFQVQPGTDPHYQVTSLRNAITSACRRGKLERWFPYQLRTTKGTEVALKHGTEVAAALLGNSVKVLKAHYDHGQFERVKRAMG